MTRERRRAIALEMNRLRGLIAQVNAQIQAEHRDRGRDLDAMIALEAARDQLLIALDWMSDAIDRRGH